MGLRPLAAERWLEFDETADEELALKEDLLARSYDAVVATTPSGENAAGDLLDEVVAWLTVHHPERLGELTSEHPIVAASRLVQEDLCVLERSDAWRLTSACVCFPSRWNLASKLGATLDEIHAPVPVYDEQLAEPTNAFFDRLTPAKSYWRLNWTLLDSATLHQPRGERRAPSGELAQWFFRVERQTLRRLERSRAVVFTIRTYVECAADLVAREREFGPHLLRALVTAPASVRAYKGWDGVAERLRHALEG